MKDPLDQLDYYALLSVGRDASESEIKSAFRRFALQFHPDRHPKDSPKGKRAVEIYQRGSEAYRTLSNAQLRAIYDRNLAAGNLRIDRRKARVEVTPKVSEEEQAAVAYLKPLMEQAEVAMEKEQWRAAAEILRAALRIDPRNERLREQLKTALQQLKKTKPSRQ
jgi:curved DNA-binding protein CbpA